MDVHQAVVRVQGTETTRLLDERDVAVHALHAIHPRVVERHTRAIEMCARVEDGEVAHVAQARRLHRTHDEAAAQHRDDEGERDDRDRCARAHRVTSRARA